MATMKKVMHDRMIDVCKVQLSAAKRSLDEANRPQQKPNRAQTPFPLDPDRTSSTSTEKPIVQHMWSDTGEGEYMPI